MEELTNRVVRLEERVNEMEKDIVESKTLVEQSNRTNDRLAEAVDGLKSAITQIGLTLVKMQNEISQNSAELNELKAVLKTQVDNQSFNFVSFIKQNFPAVLMFLYIIFEHFVNSGRIP